MSSKVAPAIESPLHPPTLRTTAARKKMKKRSQTRPHPPSKSPSGEADNESLQEAAKKAVTAGIPPPPPGSAVLKGLEKQIGTISVANHNLLVNKLTDENREINRQLAVKNVQYEELFSGVKADQQKHRLIKGVLRQCHDWVDVIEQKISGWMIALDVRPEGNNINTRDLANIDLKIEELKRVMDVPIVDAHRPLPIVQPIPTAHDPVLVHQASAVVRRPGIFGRFGRFGGWKTKKKKKKGRKKSRRGQRRRRGKKSRRGQRRRRGKKSRRGQRRRSGKKGGRR